MPVRSWDVFCTVVDNFGDIGVCWRLARQLAQEHGHAVRLWVDDLASFARLAPEIEAGAARQRLAGVEIRHWTGGRAAAMGDDVVPHDVVVEAFACDLPDDFLARMAARATPPAWINLEYLSAEGWVREHHGMASPHPRLPLTKYFFFPGFEPGTGGVLRESMLGAQRAAFLSSPAAQARLWHRLGVTPQPGALRISLFSYGNAAMPALLEQWRDGAGPVQCIVAGGLSARQVEAWTGAPAPVGTEYACGNLRLHVVPFLRQEQYDELLWACDVNFVRGEDSFVRAQWALRPFVWQIYPQDDDAHRVKLDAFLDAYTTPLRRRGDAGQAAAAALTAFWHAWNGAGDVPQWGPLHASLQTLASAAARWEGAMAHVGDLAANLVAFCENRVE
ncbi:elongation factor P maturation arginine rhamnosyltransferase EarP [Cupriavidus respiraculi]|uniref:Protein-arginine rhamnosyltransferase n=1 Tax=Cupriavidus respiraculi TaxID=195930 RepID=A0ABN7ZAS7_9BURK|nr:elongation factor P maturation arginine rhamnosyltransferase EarP [Cupriavidus respiraculi]CAG9181477.1 hypothetical protein LMG21510_04303 [Cupriavidus respiraculi]